jgi:hypothetical protein
MLRASAVTFRAARFLTCGSGSSVTGGVILCKTSTIVRLSC